MRKLILSAILASAVSAGLPRGGAALSFEEEMGISVKNGKICADNNCIGPNIAETICKVLDWKSIVASSALAKAGGSGSGTCVNGVCVSPLDGFCVENVCIPFTYVDSLCFFVNNQAAVINAAKQAVSAVKDTAKDLEKKAKKFFK